MKKFALEIRTSTVDTRKICSWFTKWYETKEELEKELVIMWELKEDYKATHVTEIEWVGGK